MLSNSSTAESVPFNWRSVPELQHVAGDAGERCHCVSLCI